MLDILGSLQASFTAQNGFLRFKGRGGSSAFTIRRRFVLWKGFWR